MDETEALVGTVENQLRPRIARASFERRSEDARRLQQELEAEQQALLNGVLREFGDVIPEPRGAGCTYSSCHPATHGLMSALRDGVVLAAGRQGALGSPKAQIEDRVWNGNWTFHVGANVAKGGVPYVEVYDLTISRPVPSLEQIVSQERPSPGLRKLSRRDEHRLRSFLIERGPCGEQEAWEAAQDELGRDFSRTELRRVRNLLGDSVRGRVGRPRRPQ